MTGAGKTSVMGKAYHYWLDRVRNQSNQSALARCVAVAGAAVLVTFCLDAAVFRSGLYKRAVAPDSSAGSVQQLIRIERARQLPFERRVLVLGNSQQAEGFSATLAAKASQADRIAIVNAGVPGLTQRDWFYLVRDLDPERTRYNVIAIPFTDYSDLDYGENMANRIQDLNFMIGSLKLQDLISFPASFPAPKDRWTAFRGALFEGLVYRDDIRDFLHAPRLRLAIAADHRLHGADWQDGYAGNQKSLEGLSYDARTGAVTFPSGTSAETEQFVRSRLNAGSAAMHGVQRAFAWRWLTAVENWYRGKDVRFILFRMPQYPVHLRLPEADPDDPASVVNNLERDKRNIVLAETRFDWLESPEYAFDGLHLNSRGRIAFSQAFATELRRVLSAFHPKGA